MQSDSIVMIEDALKRVLDMHKRSPWLDSHAAAEYLACTSGTLKTWRSLGQGPKYHVIQRKLIRYHIDDLDAFVRGEVMR